MNNQQTQYIEEDEIDLRELWKIIVKGKITIVVLTTVITITAIIYALFKNPTPIYSGTVMIEIGEVKSNNPNQTYFDNTFNLKNIIEGQYTIEVLLPKKANVLDNFNNTVILKADNINKDKIEQSLKDTVEYIINRHKAKINLYEKYIMTKQIGKIKIDDSPINTPKKKLIVVVAFITGLILSIFLVFFLDFISKMKEDV